MEENLKGICGCEVVNHIESTHPIESSPHIMDNKHEQTEARGHEHIHEEPV